MEWRRRSARRQSVVGILNGVDYRDGTAARSYLTRISRWKSRGQARQQARAPCRSRLDRRPTVLDRHGDRLASQKASTCSWTCCRRRWSGRFRPVVLERDERYTRSSIRSRSIIRSALHFIRARRRMDTGGGGQRYVPDALAVRALRSQSMYSLRYGTVDRAPNRRLPIR